MATCKEAAILGHHVSTVTQNVGLLLLADDFYSGITVGVIKM